MPPNKFKFSRLPTRKPTKIPKLSHLKFGVAEPAPQAVAEKFKNCDVIVAVDIETHSLVPENTKRWVEGQFGFKARVGNETVANLRIVQLGWAVGERSVQSPSTFGVVIKPDGFAITPEASRKHHISHDMAVATGTPLRDALQLMFNDVLDACARGGRLVAHHLEFDAGIIAEELSRVGLHHLKPSWLKIVRGGLCTMDPDIACWVRSIIGMCEAHGSTN